MSQRYRKHVRMLHITRVNGAVVEVTRDTPMQPVGPVTIQVNGSALGACESVSVEEVLYQKPGWSAPWLAKGEDYA